MEVNVQKNKVKKISRQPSPVQIMIDQKQLETAGYFSCLGNKIRNNARRTREMKSRIVMKKGNIR
jgi:hypothetical protein